MGYYNLKLPDDYTVKVHLIFWINKENNMFSYETEKQFLKLFPDKVAEIRVHPKSRRSKFDKLADQVSLFVYLNELTK